MGSINSINIGVIGYGYWGPNLVRNFSELSGANVRTVSDFSPDLLAKAKARYPAIQITTDCNDIFNDPEIDAVAIATPVSTHFKLALAALQSGKHVMVEKPMTMTSEQSIELLAEAKRQNRILMVDHTFVYTGVVHKIDTAVLKVLYSTQFILGSEVAALEAEFANNSQAKFGIAFNTGISALH